MSNSNAVELADRLSRRRPYAVVFAAGFLIFLRLFVHPGAVPFGFFASGYGWVVCVATLLLGLLPIAGIGWGRGVRGLVNDDVSTMHVRSATVAGFWLAMATALGLVLMPMSATLGARYAIYLIVTVAAAGALLAFGWLEWRAQRNG